MSEEHTKTIPFHNFRKLRSAKNESNQFIYERLNNLRKMALFKDRHLVANSYEKVLRSLEKYPLPILTAQQAFQLDGVGVKMANLIAEVIQKNYATFIENPEPVFQIDVKDIPEENEFSLFFNSQNSPSKESVEKEEITPRNVNIQPIIDKDLILMNSQESSDSESPKAYVNPLKRQRELEEKNSWEVIKVPLKRYYTAESYLPDTIENAFQKFTNQLWSNVEMTENGLKSSNSLPDQLNAAQGKRSKNYRPESKTNGFNILIGLLKYESETNRKYANKKEIKQALKKDPELKSLQIKNWTAMSTLVKNGLIDMFIFSDEEKFCLTEQGYTLATECYVDALSKNTSELELAIMESLALKDLSSEYYEIKGFSNPSAFKINETSEDSRNVEISEVEEQTSKLKITEILPSKAVALCNQIVTELPEEDPSFKINEKFEENQNVEISDAEEQTMKSKITNGIASKAVVLNNKIVIGVTKEDFTEDEDEQTINFTKFEKLSTEKLSVKKNIQPKKNANGMYEVNKSLIKSWNFMLCVNNQNKNKHKNYIYEKLLENEINCKIMNINIGDFIWMVEIENEDNKFTYVLDYIIERKTLDDLASCVIEKRIKQQKKNLLSSNMKNIFLLIEGETTQNPNISLDKIQKTIAEIHLDRKLKVFNTHSLDETIKRILAFNTVVETKFVEELLDSDNSNLFFRYNLEEYQEMILEEPQEVTTHSYFKNMLSSMKECDKEMIDRILNKFGSLYQFYHAMKLLDKEGEQFGLFDADKGHKKFIETKELEDIKALFYSNIPLTNHIFTLFFEDSYPKPLKKDVKCN